ncbi:hypothetical protein LCGC14_1924950 [marine sediment metagenome]|uniref:Uncharacterized protein n=1 Tax=marine sediment metagenome TaxID=412755 RepID=A0A0F9GD40_9ZZZZ
MTIHHRWYIFNDVIYSKYPKTSEGQLQYYTDLEPLIIADPERFRYTCNTDHQSLERLIRFGDKKLKKLLRERKVSKSRR